MLFKIRPIVWRPAPDGSIKSEWTHVGTFIITYKKFKKGPPAYMCLQTKRWEDMGKDTQEWYFKSPTLEGCKKWAQDTLNERLMQHLEKVSRDVVETVDV